MNQHQRKFLLEEIEKQYRRERDELSKRKPEQPSLNNFLVAAILDGSAVMASSEQMREAIRERVRDLGKGKALVQNSRDSWSSRREDDEVDMIQIPALLLYQEPTSFIAVREKYEAALKAWNEEVRSLDASINAMRIKVQVGSDKALDSLVSQADQLCSMSLTASSRLLLPGKTE